MIHNFVKITILRVSYSKIHFLYFVITNFRCMFFFILTTDLICSVSFLPNKLKSILEVKGKCHKFYFNVLWSAFILFNFLSREAIWEVCITLLSTSSGRISVIMNIEIMAQRNGKESQLKGWMGTVDQH